jgi:hypothetical protein
VRNKDYSQEEERQRAASTCRDASEHRGALGGSHPPRHSTCSQARHSGQADLLRLQLLCFTRTFFFFELVGCVPGMTFNCVLNWRKLGVI